MVTLKHKLRGCLYECICTRWSCWHHWRGWCKPAVAAFYLILLVAVLPLLILKVSKKGNDSWETKAWFVAGLFVLLTLPVFLGGLLQHVLNYTQPHLQKHIIRILWVVPIYSLNSWLAFTFPKAAIYLDTMRECYEAYVLYNFLCYLCNYLTSEYNLVTELEARPIVSQPIPFCCLPPWPKGARFIRWCRIGVLQYTVVRILVTIVALITQLCGVYQKGDMTKMANAYIYLTIINVISQGIALHSLIYFYKGTRELLKPIHPVGKFLSIKAIVFAMFWQAVLIAVLVKVGAIPETWEGPQEKLQNFVVVVEMLLFAVAHYFIFSHKPYIDPAAAEVPCITTCLRMLDVRDVAGDVKEHFVDPIPRPRFKIRNMLNGSSTTGSDEENGGMAVQENSPLLKKAKISELRPSTSSTLGAVAHSEDSRSDTEGVSGQTRSRQQQQLSELSYDVLTYKEFDNRTGYGLRARMIASAAASLGVVDETKDSTTPSSSEGKSSSSSSSAVTSDTEKEVTSLK